MDIEEARATLDVTADATPAEVRRAYTRLLKKHKPERDPDGFRRVREAFELLAQGRAATPAHASSDEPESAPQAETSADDEHARPSAAEPSSATEPSPTAQAPSADDPAMIAARGAMAARVRAQRIHDVGLALSQMSEHLRAFPKDDGVRLALVGQLEARESFVEAIEVLRTGAEVAADPLRFMSELAIWKPSTLDAAAIARLRAEPRCAPYAAVALVAHQRLEEARRTALDGIAHDAEQPGTPSRGPWLRAIAGMYERGASALAADTMRELDRAMPADARSADDETLVPTLLLRELGDVAPDIEPELARMLGMFVGSPHRGAAMLVAEPWLPQRLSNSVQLLVRRAPSLARLALSAFDVVRAPPPRPARKNVTPGQAVAVIAAALVIASVFAFAVTHLPRTPPSRARPTPVTELASSREGRLVCADRPSSDECELVHRVEAEVEVGECERARAHAMELQNHVLLSFSFGRETRIAVSTFEQRVRTLCPIETSDAGGSP